MLLRSSGDAMCSLVGWWVDPARPQGRRSGVLVIRQRERRGDSPEAVAQTEVFDVSCESYGTEGCGFERVRSRVCTISLSCKGGLGWRLSKRLRGAIFAWLCIIRLYTRFRVYTPSVACDWMLHVLIWKTFLMKSKVVRVHVRRNSRVVVTLTKIQTRLEFVKKNWASWCALGCLGRSSERTPMEPPAPEPSDERAPGSAASSSSSRSRRDDAAADCIRRHAFEGACELFFFSFAKGV